MKSFFKRLWLKLFGSKSQPEPSETKVEEERREDNKDPNDSREPKGELLLWYPGAKKNHAYAKLKMKTRGRYKNGYPKGAVVHFTAGRSRPKPYGGTRNASSAEQQAQWSIKSAVDNGSFAYFLIDADGNVYQQFPLNEWGYHAGTSSWKGLSGNVSDELVGIEVMCAGKLEDAGNGKYKAWFTTTSKGDALFDEREVRHAPTDRHNIKRGVYHKYTEFQEQALTELLLWLEKNGQGIFKIDYVLGHDEVAPGRKSDPGASLSMSMPEYRQVLKRKKSNA